MKNGQFKFEENIYSEGETGSHQTLLRFQHNISECMNDLRLLLDNINSN